MTQRTIVLTGASDGIGAAAARRLAARGERLLLAGRSPEKLAAVAEPLGAEFFAADFEHLAEVRRLAAWVQERAERVDVLVNNAGGVFGDRMVTEDGNERTMQVNHYAAFLLTHLLLERLQAGGATIVNTSSVGAKAFGKIDLADLDNQGRYRTMKTYGDSKLANILFTKGLHARYHAAGLSSVALHPGNIASNFGSTGSPWMKAIYRTPLRHLLDTPEDGAGNLLWAIDGTPGQTWRSGEYYESRKLPRRPNPQQNDPRLVDGLWVESARRVGVKVTAA
jgi:NAD(P)-dependent dehydrogenase (short-subunit alcohol dehydrogenase family)